MLEINKNVSLKKIEIETCILKFGSKSLETLIPVFCVCYELTIKFHFNKQA